MRPSRLLLPLVLLACACLRGVEPARGPRSVSERFDDLAHPQPLDQVLPDERAAVAEPEPTPARELLARDLVALVELAAPPRRTFLLRATLPVAYGAPAGDAPSDPPGEGSASVPLADPFRLGVIDHGPSREIVPAQVEIVARRADGRPDVIEVLAPVELSPKESQGSRVRFNVVRLAAEQAPEPSADAGAGGFEEHRAVASLLDPAGRATFELRCEDVFGNRYVADLRGYASSPGFGSLRALEEGPWRRRTRLAAVLAAAAAPGEGPPLPHLMGVHAFLTEVAGDARLALDLRVHSGLLSGRRRPTRLELPVGIVYWKSLELVLPRQWNVLPLVPDPFFGPARVEGELLVVPLVRANPDGSLHVMGPGMQFQRRLSLSTEPQTDREPPLTEGLAFALPGEGVFEWSRERAGRYFPQRTALPRFDPHARAGFAGLAGLRARMAGELAARAALIGSGQPNGDDVVTGVLGWAHPWLYKYGGTTGGTAIAYVEGHEVLGAASAAGYAALALVHRMNASRQREAAWDARGDPVGYHAWLDVATDRVLTSFRPHGGILPEELRLPAFGGAPASDQVLEVHRRGLRPSYDQGTVHLPKGTTPGIEENLWAWTPHDGQHYVRWTKDAKALVWLGNDQLARDDLRLSAELAHLWLHESAGPGETVGDLLALERHASQNPNEGCWLGREAAWAIDAACAAYSVLEPPWRERQRGWLVRIARALVAAATPGGILQRNNNPKLLGHDRYDATQTFETLFLLHAMRCLNESVLRDQEPEAFEALSALYLRTVEYLFFGPAWIEWGGQGAGAPASSFAVAWADGYQRPPFSDAETWGPGYLPADGRTSRGEGLYGWTALEYAAAISDPEQGSGIENRYLQRALRYGGARSDARRLLAELWAETSRRTTDHSSGWVGLAARVEEALSRATKRPGTK